MYELTRLLKQILFFILLLLSSHAAADSYLNQLVTHAKQLNLHQHTYWLKLLHYKPNLFGGYSSEVLSRNFFTSQHGRTDPEAELKTTLAAFFF